MPFVIYLKKNIIKLKNELEFRQNDNKSFQKNIDYLSDELFSERKTNVKICFDLHSKITKLEDENKNNI